MVVDQGMNEGEYVGGGMLESCATQFSQKGKEREKEVIV